MLVICNKRASCSINKNLLERFNEPCGGAIPHDYSTECDHCPSDATAICEGVSR